ncbi:stress-related protein-like isoform X2 [Primulina eburnea]|uniref:stress-related protein-like isoform X2 n=1 Tax=Primulina eburnea TaxID=1245227 RepID=UPI003C6C122C
MEQADSNPKSNFMEEDKRLKYLEFVQIAALHALICASRFYNYAKEKSGPLKPGIHSVEDTVKNVVSPVYDKYHHLPIEVLMFLDRKVDESVNKVQSSVPPTLKQVSTEAMDTAQKAPQAARSVLADVKNTGMVGTASGLAKTVYTKCEPTAKYMYTKYEPVAESAWQSLNKLPLFPRVAQAVAPTASYCSEMYNHAVQVSSEKGFKVASYLPWVPTEKIAKMLYTGNMAEPLVSGVH